jgi:hypothetical protein
MIWNIMNCFFFWFFSFKLVLLVWCWFMFSIILGWWLIYLAKGVSAGSLYLLLRCKGDLILHQQSLAPLKVAHTDER